MFFADDPIRRSDDEAATNNGFANSCILFPTIPGVLKEDVGPYWFRNNGHIFIKDDPARPCDDEAGQTRWLQKSGMLFQTIHQDDHSVGTKHR